MSSLLKECFFPIDNIRIQDPVGKNSRCLINHHIHNYWEIKVFPEDKLVILIPPNVPHDATPELFSESANFVLGFMHPRIALQMKDGKNECTEMFCLFSRVDDLCPGGIVSIFRKIQVLLGEKTRNELFEKLLNKLLELVFSAINTVLENASDKDKKAGFTIVERACDYIERQYYRGDLTVEKTALYLGVTPGHLANLFHKESLGTVRQYLIQTRLKHAMRLLGTGHYTVKDVTELTGWNNQFYFSNCFKKHYKISPSRVPLSPETEIIRTKNQ